MITVNILEDTDIIQATDYCRPLLLCTISKYSDNYSFTNTYSGQPENNVKWLRVDRAFGPCWVGKTVAELVSKVIPYEFIRGDIPLLHRYGKTRADILLEYNDYLTTTAMPVGKYLEYTCKDVQLKNPEYFAWAISVGLIKEIEYDS